MDLCNIVKLCSYSPKKMACTGRFTKPEGSDSACMQYNPSILLFDFPFVSRDPGGLNPLNYSTQLIDVP